MLIRPRRQTLSYYDKLPTKYLLGENSYWMEHRVFRLEMYLYSIYSTNKRNTIVLTIYVMEYIYYLSTIIKDSKHKRLIIS